MKYVFFIFSMFFVVQLFPLTEDFKSVYITIQPFVPPRLDDITLFFLACTLFLTLVLFHKWRQSNHIRQTNQKLKDQISLRGAAEYRLKDRKVHYRDFFEDDLSGSFVVHPLGKLIACNREYARILGFDSAQDALNRPVMESLNSPEQGRLFIEKLAAEKLITNHRLELRHKTGGPIYLTIYAMGRFSDQGDLEHIRGFILDKTDHKALEEKQVLSKKMESMGSLANGVAHDLNNILSGIIGYSQLAKLNLKMPVRLDSNLNQILKGARRATDLIQQILNFGLPSASEKQIISLIPLVKEVLKLLHSTIPATIVIEEHLFSRAMVLADPGKMHQVIMNLCTNACQAMPLGKGLLSIALDEQVVSKAKNPDSPADMSPGRYLRLRVRDTGSGIEDGIMEKIFDPYFTTKEPGKGTGLGLSLVHGIVEEYGGYIDVTSIKGRGTTFSIFLPIAESSEESPGSISPEIPGDSLPGVKSLPGVNPLPRGRESIMFIHEQEERRLLSTEFLGELGYKAYGFANGKDAFEAFQRNPAHYDLIITDLIMPLLTGSELATKVVSIKADFPVIVCSDYGEDPEESKAAAVSLCMKRPLVLDDLAMAIRELLDNPKYIIL